MRLLLWNVNRTNPARVLSRLAAREEFDVIVLLELDAETNALIQSVETLSGLRYSFAEGECKTVNVFVREGTEAFPLSEGAIAGERERVVQGIAYPCFYNPMWNLMGDDTPGPPGTYFYRSAEQVTYFWHMFDQVLLRPDLLTNFNPGGVKIVESDGEMSFMDDHGRPGSELGSDHFPVALELSFPTVEA